MLFSFSPFSKKNITSDIRLLAVSTHMTEISYAISDIQTRIFGKSVFSSLAK